MVIDQHALHERILYEELRARVEKGRVESQRLLVPDPVHLAAADAALVLEHREVLGEMGLEIEPFGGDTVLVVSARRCSAGSSPTDCSATSPNTWAPGPCPPRAMPCSPTCSTWSRARRR